LASGWRWKRRSLCETGGNPGTRHLSDAPSSGNQSGGGGDPQQWGKASCHSSA
jgi:hypothetical protein